MRYHARSTGTQYGLVVDRDEHWTVLAACRDADPELFTPLPHANEVEIEEALAFCRRCTVRVECLEDGNDDKWSIRGGLTAAQRESSRRYQAHRRMSESAQGMAAVNFSKTHCPQMHLYDFENTYVDSRGNRHCRACARERVAAKRLAAEVPNG